MVEHKDKKLRTAWYSKPADTDLMLSFRSRAPKLYKRNIIEGTACRINNTTSSWNKFHYSLVSAKCIFGKNQYPPPYYDPIVENAISKVFTQKEQRATDAKLKERKSSPTLLMEYRGHISDRFSRIIRKEDHRSMRSVYHTENENCLTFFEEQDTR